MVYAATSGALPRTRKAKGQLVAFENRSKRKGPKENQGKPKRCSFEVFFLTRKEGKKEGQK